MTLRDLIESLFPRSAAKASGGGSPPPSRARAESNRWLRLHCKDIRGRVLSIGSENDADGEGDFYRRYFPMADSYTTSEVAETFKCDLALDIRSMPGIADQSYDCIYCSGVLEHVDDFHVGLEELTRILKPAGVLLLGLPFRQAIHMAPHDFWRFTEHGIRYLLKKSYEIEDLAAIDLDGKSGDRFPASYWVKARKTPRN